MATDASYIEFMLDQLQAAGAVTAKKLFGEYGLYLNETLFGLVCDNRLFIKPTAAGRTYIGAVVEAAPYGGAKPYFLIGEQLEDRQWLAELVRLTVTALPESGRKKGKK